MANFPPHLPSPSSSLRWRRLKERSLVVVAFSLCGLVAGVAGTALVLGWGLKDFTVFNPLTTAPDLSAREVVLDDSVRHQVESQLYTLYRASTAFGGGVFLNTHDTTAVGVLINADNWLVAYAPGQSALAHSWQVLGPDEQMYRIDKVIADRLTNLLYLHIVSINNSVNTGRELPRAASFAPVMSAGDPLFVNDNRVWLTTRLQVISTAAVVTPHLDGLPATSYNINISASPGSVVVGNDGRFVGFVINGNKVFPLSRFADSIPSIVQSGRATYASLGAEGWWSEEQPIVVSSTRVYGFMVNRIVDKNSKLRRGDIIREINGQSATSDNLIKALLETNARLRVWRNGAMVELTSPVVHL